MLIYNNEQWIRIVTHFVYVCVCVYWIDLICCIVLLCYLQTNQEKINIIKTQKHFSKSFNILLSPQSTDIDNTMIDATDAKSLDDGNSDQTKQLRQYLKNVIQSETEETEDRIERYTKQQRASLKAYCDKAEQDFHDILR